MKLNKQLLIERLYYERRNTMITIEIDKEVFDKLREIAIPFVDTTPNLAIRRLLGLSASMTDKSVVVSSKKHSIQKSTNRREILYNNFAENDYLSNLPLIEQLRNASLQTHSAFLTFLMDKFHHSHGNYKTSDIIVFMEEVNLRSISGTFRNPWMKAPYRGDKNGLTSCQRTIEHFRQTRKFGCWGGRDTKKDCDAIDTCIYHPENDDEIGNKCDLRKGVIWKRSNPDSPFTYGAKYLNIVEKELLKGNGIHLETILAVFYPDKEYNQDLIELFKYDFNFNSEEMSNLFIT